MLRNSSSVSFPFSSCREHHDISSSFVHSGQKCHNNTGPPPLAKPSQVAARLTGSPKVREQSTPIPSTLKRLRF